MTVATKATQTSMELNANSGSSVTCLGMEFPNDDARRTYFRERLREYLEDPKSRAQEGFPDGDVDAILEMSDPPYYTACPNPFVREFINLHGRKWDPAEPYSRAPLAIDVSVGKTDALYKAHGYHTKVPHQAIVPSILHYTNPGDIVLDGFGGSGMTGVAAEFCGTAPASYRAQIEREWADMEHPKPVWGARKAVINDLSPAASFIAANYTTPFDVDAFKTAARELLQAVHADVGWMYATKINGEVKRIEYTIWSEVFACSSCSEPITFLDADQAENDGGRSKIICSACGAASRKEEMTLITETFVDPATGSPAWRPKREAVAIVYKNGRTSATKTIDEEDRALLKRIASLRLPDEVPLMALPESQMSNVGRMKTTNVKAIHHFFLPRAAHGMAALWRHAHAHPNERTRKMLVFGVEQAIWGMSVLNRYSPTHFSQVNRALNGVFYVGSKHSECSPWYILEGKFHRLAKAFEKFQPEAETVTTTVGTSSRLPVSEESIDYIFTDPPFGANIYYADLNFLVEAWHGVHTRAADEAIVDSFKDKGLPEYQDMMRDCFSEYFRVLKSGRWMTVVFSNSRASVWNSIQVALQQAGFVVAEVTALDKTQGSFRQVTSANAVKQDLVVSCYKPNGGLEERFDRGVTDDTVWDFVRTHLKNLAVVKRGKDGSLETIAERDPRRIFDRMVAWFVRHNTPVPIANTAEFQEGLLQRFPERDGMIFLANQVDEYDRKRLAAGQAPQRELFVDDERTAIDWLSDFLKAKPSTYQDIHPEFTQKTGAGWRKHEERPELAQLLDDNFLKFDGKGPVPNQIHRHLSSNWKDLRNLDKDDPALIEKARDRWYVPDPNKQQDVEKRREKALLKEFERYRTHKGKKMKEVRLEAMRAGFKAAWGSKDYQTITDVAGKVPEDAWQEDEKLLMYFDMASTRLQAGK